MSCATPTRNSSESYCSSHRAQLNAAPFTFLGQIMRKKDFMSAQVGIKSDCLPTVCHQLHFSTRIGIDINYSKQCYAYAPNTQAGRHTLKQQLCGILLLSRDKEQEEGSWSGGIVAHNRLISLRAIALRTQHWQFFNWH